MDKSLKLTFWPTLYNELMTAYFYSSKC